LQQGGQATRKEVQGRYRRETIPAT
jgi:hypothetical protein